MQNLPTTVFGPMTALGITTVPSPMVTRSETTAAR
jgi:hypothetical protein